MKNETHTQEEEETARQILTLHKNLSLFVNGAPLPVLISSLTMLLTEVIVDVANDQLGAQRIRDNFILALTTALDLTYEHHSPSEYMQ